jgi:sensor histidine kinase YesM
LISIKDNGIGRTESQALKTDNQKKYKSTGLENVGKRIELINELYGKGFEVSVEDLNSEKKETGTLVKITIPV